MTNIEVGTRLTVKETGSLYRVRKVNYNDDGDVRSYLAVEISHQGHETTATIVIWPHELRLFHIYTLCKVSTEDGNPDDPMTYYCGYPHNHAGEHGAWRL